MLLFWWYWLPTQGNAKPLPPMRPDFGRIREDEDTMFMIMKHRKHVLK